MFFFSNLARKARDSAQYLFLTHLPSEQIVGVEAFAVGGGLHAPTRQTDLLLQHFKALREIPGLSQAKIILVPESNYAWESQRYALDIIGAGVPGIYLMDEDEKQQGFRTSNKSKKMMAMLFNVVLNAHCVKFHPLAVSVSSTRQKMRDLLIKQLGAYKRKITAKKGEGSEFAKPTETYTGKIGGHADDQAVMVQLNYIAHNIYTRKYEEKYKNLPPLGNRYPSEHAPVGSQRLDGMGMTSTLLPENSGAMFHSDPDSARHRSVFFK